MLVNRHNKKLSFKFRIHKCLCHPFLKVFGRTHVLFEGPLCPHTSAQVGLGSDSNGQSTVQKTNVLSVSVIPKFYYRSNKKPEGLK